MCGKKCMNKRLKEGSAYNTSYLSQIDVFKLQSVHIQLLICETGQSYVIFIIVILLEIGYHDPLSC